MLYYYYNMTIAKDHVNEANCLLTISSFSPQTGYMAKKLRRKAHPTKTVKRSSASSAKTREGESQLLIIRGWFFIVAFALMLGIGAMVGTLMNQMLNESTPTVAGVTTAR